MEVNSTLRVYDAHNIKDFLGTLLDNGPPKRREPDQPTPHERIWGPNGKFKMVREASITARREELEHLFRGFPDLPIRRHFHSDSWGRFKRFNSLVLGQAMPATSLSGFDVFADLELDASNHWYIEQPMRLRYDYEGARRTRRPDVLVPRGNWMEAVEVKYEAQASVRENKWEAIGSGWSLEFAAGRLAKSRPLVVLRVTNVYTQECIALAGVDSSSDMPTLKKLDIIIRDRGQPTTIVAGNSMALKSMQTGVIWRYIYPMQIDMKAANEFFIRHLHNIRLTETVFDSIRHATIMLNNQRNRYNKKKLHAAYVVDDDTNCP